MLCGKKKAGRIFHSSSEPEDGFQEDRRDTKKSVGDKDGNEKHAVMLDADAAEHEMRGGPKQTKQTNNSRRR